MMVHRERLLMVVSAVCFLLAALSVAFGPAFGPGWAWGFGGFAAWALSGAV